MIQSHTFITIKIPFYLFGLVFPDYDVPNTRVCYWITYYHVVGLCAIWGPVLEQQHWMLLLCPETHCIWILALLLGTCMTWNKLLSLSPFIICKMEIIICFFSPGVFTTLYLLYVLGGWPLETLAHRLSSVSHREALGRRCEDKKGGWNICTPGHHSLQGFGQRQPPLTVAPASNR